jgi:hypothetical protein
VREDVVVLLLAFGLLDGQLQLTDHFPHEHEVHHNVVGWVLQLVFDADQPKLVSHCVVLVENVHSFEESDKAAFAASKSLVSTATKTF